LSSRRKNTKDRSVYKVVESNNGLALQNCSYSNYLTDPYQIDDESLENFKDIKIGDVIVSYKKPNTRRVNISKIIGHESDPSIEILISAYEAGIKMQFTKAALKEVKRLSVPSIDDVASGVRREDLREVPLVTIDPDRAGDFDDAIFAEKITEENFARIQKIIRRTKDFAGKPIKRRDVIGGYYVLSAIADVAHYVRPKSALNRDARMRGSTWYYANGSEPMLPEKLSKGLCSLVPNEDRACFAHHMIISPEGELVIGRVSRALMNSEARLTYGQVQSAMDGSADAQIEPLMDNVIRPLYEMGTKVQKAKEARDAINIDSKEYELDFDEKVKVTGISERVKYKSNKIVEAVALLNNQLMGKILYPAIYRVHGKPRRPYKLVTFIDSLNKTLPAEDKIKYDVENITSDTAIEILKQVRASTKISKDDKEFVEESVLSCQQAAEYSTKNIGHFGLKLDAYIHSTSPIRRYADLIEQRLAIKQFRLGNDGISEEELAELDAIAHKCTISHHFTKIAQGTSQKRYLAQYYKKDINKVYSAKVVSVNGNGVVIRVNDALRGVIPLENLVAGNCLQYSKEQDILVQNDTIIRKERNDKEYKLIFNTVTENSLLGKIRYGHVRNKFERNSKILRKMTTISSGKQMKVRLVEADNTSGRIVFEQIPTLSQRLYLASIELHKEAKEVRYKLIKSRNSYKQRKHKEHHDKRYDVKWVL